jgi:hypothetical protein
MASLHQDNVARYHAAMATHAGHGGHEMYRFHYEWHQRNPVPDLPKKPDRNWGMDLDFGTNFLQMHHEMVKAAAGETRQHMAHQSIVSWYQQEKLALPSQWNPLSTIPSELGYVPDLNAFPDEIRTMVERFAREDRTTPAELLKRRTDTPEFELPKYFTIQGVGPREAGDPITGARKLADFQNTNQLGCCIVFPHNTWHGSIGGAMGFSLTAIADPIFYFGVHWLIDRVYDDYKSLKSERSIRALDTARLIELNALGAEGLEVEADFTSEEKAWLAEQAKISQKFHRK